MELKKWLECRDIKQSAKKQNQLPELKGKLNKEVLVDWNVLYHWKQEKTLELNKISQKSVIWQFLPLPS